MAASTKMRGSILCLFVLSVQLVGVLSAPKFVSTSLSAKWMSTPILLETSEYIAKLGNSEFWGFVEEVTDEDVEMLQQYSDQEKYHLFVEKKAVNYLTPVQLNLLKFSLSLRAHSATVEMHNQMAKHENAPKNCEVFINLNNVVTCEKMAIKAIIGAAKDSTPAQTFQFDHTYPGMSKSNSTAILYAEIGTQSFKEWHGILKDLASKGELTYILRHFVKNESPKKTRLSGYGVELAIKSQEYKAKDDTKVEDDGSQGNSEDDEEDVEGFIFSKLKKLHPEDKDNLVEFKKYLQESKGELAPLKAWQLQDLSFQAAQKVLSSPSADALRVLTDISQNFPTQARSLVSIPVDGKVKKEIKKNQELFSSAHGIDQGENGLYLNGLPIDLETYDIFNLLDTMKSEARLMDGLFSLGLKGSYLSDLMKIDTSSNTDSFAVDTRDPAVQFLNNLEKDRRYANWPGRIDSFLQPTFPGMLRHVRKNCFNLVFIVNPAEPQSKDLLKMAEAFNVHNAPIRIGIVFVVSDDPELDGFSDLGIALLRAFNFIKNDKDLNKALSFITDVYERDGVETIDSESVIEEFKDLYSDEDVKDVFGDDSDYDDQRQAANLFYKKTGLGALPQVLMNGVPLSQDSLTSDSFEEAVVGQILQFTPVIQRAVYNGKLTDSMDVYDWIMNQENVLPRLNDRVLGTSNTFVDFTKNTDASRFESPDQFSKLSPQEMTSVMAQNMKYITRKDEESIRSMTTWVVCDVETPEGRELMYSAIKQMKNSNDVRLGLVFNTKSPGDENFLSRAIYVAMTTLEPNMAKSFVTKLVKEENVKDLKSEVKVLADFEVHGMDMNGYTQNLKHQSGTFLKTHQIFCETVLKMEPGSRAVIANGKVIGPLDDGEAFNLEDFNLLEKFTVSSSAGKIKEKIADMPDSLKIGSDLLMKTAALLSSVPQKEGRKSIQYDSDQYSVIKIEGDTETPSYDLVAIIDPASRGAQKITPLLMVLQEVVNADIKVMFNCKDQLSEMPLKSFYRLVLEPELAFASDGVLSSGPVAKFNKMPSSPILTLNMNPPEGWLVEATRSPYDLDNIHLEEVESNGIHGEFELEYLLLEGHCFDSSSGQPPRGLQFTLGTNTTALVDTIVMANLGYFQLKANPGAWYLKLRGGRSAEIYDITNHEFTDSPSNSPEIIVVMDSFKSKIVKVKVAKKPEMAGVDLLSDEKVGSGGIWDSISSQFSGTEGSESKDEVINIFSVASGHLYERLLRIMMLSVLKHTKSKVKFWFLKNYLSPTFTETIPYMAEEYEFEYELVQYKWPRWLHQQTEKQRIIWGYKILFLDVLFPLGVQKIIFVDADQIVRADMQELVDFDLEGAPYGYVPFCDSRKEMDGFRFWKSGYWASHLGHRRYHISALYVVDLVKFRKIAAGDRLRGQYQGLSQDPNSLSNLDQDLPNNMIHQVAIKSLPQEWLYCDTWCSEDTKKYAKTIDLCNNPRTKEPKLEAAVRIAPEWADYDSELKEFLEDLKIKNKSITHSNNGITETTDKHEEL
ncbi:unnamed protein product [Owenia fusiformis]|uniref:Uncharacterized protein n=1 Tax=Owenia fusiformis TaxID=6347 RepID=A0A8J1UB93_OWEFU|nr:unnamed protein product [Owenia fusiformis]